MSDPMTNVEIEDVLSSVRRLVSEDQHTGPRKAADPGTFGKLVLTPALRIVPGAPVKPAPAAARILAEESTAAFDSMSQHAAAAVLEAALAGRPDDWEPDCGEVASVGAEDWTVEWEAPEAARPEFVSTRSDAPAPGSVQYASGRADTGASPLVLTGADRASAVPQGPENGSGRFFRGEEGNGASLLNEDVLRALVRDVLREELRGALGERITRNVRKLVRAEIGRALASRDVV